MERTALVLVAVGLAACSSGGATDAGADGGGVDAHGTMWPLCAMPEPVPPATQVVTVTTQDAAGTHTGGFTDFTGTLSLGSGEVMTFTTPTGELQIHLALSDPSYEPPVINAINALPSATMMNVSFAQGVELTSPTDGTLYFALVDVASRSATAGALHLVQSDVDCATIACSAGGGVGCATGCYQGMERTRVTVDGAAAPIAEGRSGATGALTAHVFRSLAPAPPADVVLEIADPHHAICATPLPPELAVLVAP